MNVFFSYHFDEEHPENELFVHRVSYYLKKQSGIEPYCYTDDRQRDDWLKLVEHKLKSCDKFVLFVGHKLGDIQKDEAEHFLTLNSNSFSGRSVFVELPGFTENTMSNTHGLFRYYQNTIQVNAIDENTAHQYAADIYARLTVDKQKNKWISNDGLPEGYPFDYEKDIIKDFVQGDGYLSSPKLIEQGCPREWPDVEKIKENSETHKNPIKEEVIGNYRNNNSRIIVDVRSEYHCRDNKTSCCLVDKKSLTFLEAGPRTNLQYPLGDNLRVGIVVSGGIAPGINAVIAGIVQRHKLYKKQQDDSKNYQHYGLQIYMYRDGLSGLLSGRKITLDEEIIRNQSILGGSMISTSRFDDLLHLGKRREREDTLQKLAIRLSNDDIDILYVIGGDGSMRAAHAIWTRAQEMWRDNINNSVTREISVVAIPKTMDNDVLWVWQSFGFMSAVEKSKEFILQLNTEAKSNPRLCIVQLFGSDSGFIVSHTALASGVCKAALIPEVGFTMKALSKYIQERLNKEHQDRDKHHKGQSPYGIVLLAETAIPQDVEDYIDNPEYPNLELDEGEKEAIRKFVGSSLLSMSDIIDWKALRSSLLKPQANRLKIKTWEQLPPEIQGIIKNASISPLDDEEIKSIVLKSLNNKIIKTDNFYCKNDLKDVALTPQLKEIIDFIQDLKTLIENMDALPGQKIKELAKIDSILLRLSTFSLTFETIETLKIMKQNLSNIPDERFKKLTKKLIKKLVEKSNRLLMEITFESQIKKGPTLHGERRIQGQTPDEIRTGGLKIVSHVLQKDIRNSKIMRHSADYWRQYRVFRNEPRHLIRAIPPSVSDVIFGQRLGTLAVDNAMAGYTDFMVSQWMTEYVLVPLKLVVLGRKRVPQNGIFWKSVLANTGQPANMV